LKFVRVRGRAA